MASEPLTVDRYRGALVGLALGDALGAPYEFKSPPFIVEAVFRQGVFGTAPGHPPAHPQIGRASCRERV